MGTGTERPRFCPQFRPVSARNLSPFSSTAYSLSKMQHALGSLPEQHNHMLSVWLRQCQDLRSA